MSNLRWLPLITLFVLVVPLIIACSAGTATASCAFVVGTGREGYDAKLHKVVYPGQSYTPVTGEVVTFVPCNSRNYIINDGLARDANGQQVGDRHTQIPAYTKSGVGVLISARALWTLNQTYSAMEKFYTVCFKYTCFDTKDVGGSANFSTTGWNGMLGENFSPAMDMAGRVAAFQVDDSIWQKHDPEQYKALGDKMSEQFGNVIRANLGFSEDLFCGSGNSQWSDPSNPGKGTFTCSPVRIIVDTIQLQPVQADPNSQGAAALNQQRYDAARKLYGDSTEFWLGVQDAIDKCRGSNVPCVINIGGTGSPALVVPANNATPTPAPTPKK